MCGLWGLILVVSKLCEWVVVDFYYVDNYFFMFDICIFYGMFCSEVFGGFGF